MPEGSRLSISQAHSMAQPELVVKRPASLHALLRVCGQPQDAEKLDTFKRPVVLPQQIELLGIVQLPAPLKALT